MDSDGETFSVKFADTKEAMFDAVNMKDVRQGDFCKFAWCDLNVSCDFSFANVTNTQTPYCQGHSSLDAPSELNPPQRIPSPLFAALLVPQAEG